MIDARDDQAILQAYARTSYWAMARLVQEYGEPVPAPLEDDDADFELRVEYLRRMVETIQEHFGGGREEEPSPHVRRLMALELTAIHLNLGLQNIVEFTQYLQSYVDTVLPPKNREHGRAVGRLVLAMLVTYRVLVPDLMVRIFESAGFEVHEMDPESAAQMLGLRLGRGILLHPGDRPYLIHVGSHRPGGQRC